MGVSEPEQSGEHSNAGVSETSDDSQVMAAIDDDGSHEKFIIADISVDDAWVSVRNEEAPMLEAWR
jgi:hypothetical protein